MRILTLSTHAEKCGIAVYNDQVVRAMRDKGHEVEIFPVSRQELSGADERTLRDHFAPFLRMSSRYDRLIVQHEYSFFSANKSTRYSLKIFADIIEGLHASRTPVTIIFHSEPNIGTGLFSRRRYYWRKIAKLVNSCATMDVVTHNSAALPAFHDAGFDPGKVSVHQMPMDEPNPLPPREADATVNLAMFGFVSEYKGYAEAVAALARLPDNYRLIIAGGPHPHAPEDSTFEDISRLGDPRIELTGWLADNEIAGVLARADILLAPYREGGPLGSAATVQGLVYGRPVIVTDTITFGDVQRSSGCFAMVPPRDPDALARAIERLATNPDQQNALVERGFAHARNCGFPNFVDRLLGNRDEARLRAAR